MNKSFQTSEPFFTSSPCVPDAKFLSKLFQQYKTQKNAGPSETEILKNIQPLEPDCYKLKTERRFQLSPEGCEYITSGKVGIVILAGGMGSRLGRLEPKGTFPVMPVSEKSLFQVHAEKIRVLRQYYGAPIRTYIMTNRVSHVPTVEFFRSHNWFGLPKEELFFFPQNEIPALNPVDGSLFYLSDGEVYSGPDGHGGLITALESSGVGEDLRQHGIETIHTFHVDNPLVPVLHEQFLGEHLARKSEMSSIVVEKMDGMELVGNVVYTDAAKKSLRVVEYMDFPNELAMETIPAHGLKYWAGSIGIHLIQLDFLEEMARKIRETPDFLPFHLPLKKIQTRNGMVWGIKPERFIFDVLPFAKNSFVTKANREETFTTLKKTPEPVREHLSELYASWLKRAGAVFPPEAKVEIAPSFAMDFETLKEKILPGTVFQEKKILLGEYQP